jgi:hypothetical protein
VDGGEMGGTCRDEKCTQNFTHKTKNKRHLGEIGVDGRIILKWTLKE